MERGDAASCSELLCFFRSPSSKGRSPWWLYHTLLWGLEPEHSTAHYLQDWSCRETGSWRHGGRQLQCGTPGQPADIQHADGLPADDRETERLCWIQCAFIIELSEEVTRCDCDTQSFEDQQPKDFVRTWNSQLRPVNCPWMQWSSSPHSAQFTHCFECENTFLWVIAVVVISHNTLFLSIHNMTYAHTAKSVFSSNHWKLW